MLKLLYIANIRIPTEKAHGFQIAKMAEAFIENQAGVTLLLPRRENKIVDNIKDYYGLKSLPTIVYLPNFFGFLEKRSEPAYFVLQRICFGFMAFFYSFFLSHDFIFTRELPLAFFLSICGKRVILEDHEPKKSYIFLYRLFVRKIWKKVVVPAKLLEIYASMNVPEGSYINIPNGVDMKAFDEIGPQRDLWEKKFCVPRDKKIVLYVGGFFAWKGVYTLIESAKYLPTIAVILVGGTESQTKELRKYAEDRGIRNIVVHSFMNHHDCIVLKKSADVLVLPNTATEERSEKYTTPIKLFDYMASHVPVVASDIPSLTHLLNDNVNALLCIPDNPESLAEKINVILKDNFLSKRLSDKAYKDVQQYTWDKRAQKIISFYRA